MGFAYNVAWFVRQSWVYLGCHGGTGRWRARRRFARGLTRATLRYANAARADARDGFPHQPRRDRP